MFAKLTGIVDSTTESQIVLDVSGVGYLVGCSANTLRKAAAPGEPLSLLIETWVREDAINLYGFIDPAERDWFRLLTTVQGVGAKAALAILSVLSPEGLSNAIAAQDKAPLTAADGVGPKLAGRVLSELKDKVAHFPTPTSPAGGGAETGSGTLNDALSALLNLGYRRMEAYAAVQAAKTQLGPDTKLDTLIRTALGELSQKE